MINKIKVKLATGDNKKITSNISYSLIANLVRLFFGLALFILLSKIFDLNVFGSYIYIMTISAFFMLLIDFGFNLSILNDLPKNKERIKSFLYEIMMSKSVLIIICIFIFSIFLIITGNENKFTFYIFIFAAIFQSLSMLIISLFKAFNKFEVDFYFALINNILPILFVYLFYNVLTLEIIAYIYLLSRIISFTFIFIYFKKSFIHYDKPSNLKLSLEPLIRNIKYAVHMIVGGFFLTIDIPIMKEILSFEDVAIYSAGIKLFIALMMVGDVLNTSFLPKLSEASIKDSKLFKKTVIKLNTMMFYLGVFFSLVIYIIGEEVILFLFGEKFYPLVELLPYFSLAIFIRYSSFTYGTLITIAEKQSLRASIMVVVFIIHIILNILFQEQLGVLGAIISLCLSFFILMISNMYIVYKHYDNLFLVRFLKI